MTGLLLKYWKHGVVVVLVIAAFFAIRASGYNAAEEKKQAEIDTLVAEAKTLRAQALIDAQEKTLLMGQLTTNAKVAALTKKAENSTVAKTVAERIEDHAETTPDNDCVLDTDRVHTHEIAARNSAGVPGVAGDRSGDAGGAEEFTDLDLLSVCTENYGTCHEWSRKLTWCQNHVKGIYTAQGVEF